MISHSPLFRPLVAILLLVLAPLPALYAQSCTVSSNFNGTSLPGGDYIWFNAVVSVHGLGSQPVTVNFTSSSITFKVNGVTQTVQVPAAQMNFSPSITQATTSFAGNTWTTNLPSSGLAGNDFLTAVAVQIPPGGWPGGIQPVSWTGTFQSNSTSIGVQWQWAAAVYTQFSTNYSAVGVKPVDDNKASQYQNSDHAGTPENYKQYVTGGATGGGGSNYTGSYSGTGNCPVNPIPPANVASTACNPVNSLSVLLGQSGATAYIPNGNWIGPATGVQVVPVEPAGTPVSIATPNPVNTCSSNSTTGQTVCTANNTDVYLISGSTLNTRLTSGATASTSFSGGYCYNCGVAIEPNSNTAVITMGLANSPSSSGYQFLNLNTNTFGTPITSVNEIAEEALWDPIRSLIVSPDEEGFFELQKIQGGSLTEYSNNIGGTLDSAGEDCLTGIALATTEFNNNLVLTDLTQATYVSGSPGSWSAPTQVMTIPEYANYSASESGTDGIAVAQGTHLGLVIGEYPFPPSQANAVIAIKLPSTSGNGTPALQDYAVATLPNDPLGTAFSIGCDPHTVAAYVSPLTGKAIGLITDYGYTTCYSNGTPQYVGLIDIQGLLNAPRVSGTHTVSPTYDLVGNGVVTFVAAQ